MQRQEQDMREQSELMLALTRDIVDLSAKALDVMIHLQGGTPPRRPAQRATGLRLVRREAA